MLIFIMSGRANQKLILSVWSDRPERVSSRHCNSDKPTGCYAVATSTGGRNTLVKSFSRCSEV